MTKIKTTILPLLVTLLLFTQCGSQEPARLTGEVKVEGLESMQIAYTLDGNPLNMAYYEVTPKEDGTYTFELALPDKELDVDIYINNDILGAHLVAGTTTVANITGVAGKSVDISFGEENGELSRVRNAYSRAYDMMKYFSIDPAESKTFAEYRQILETEHDTLTEIVENINDPKARDYYSRLSEGMYEWTLMRLIMDDAFDKDVKLTDYPEYVELTSNIDPNDPINIQTNKLFSWFGAELAKTGYGESSTDAYLSAMDMIDGRITEKSVRDALTQYIAYIYFIVNDGDVARFWERYKVFAKDYPKLLETYGAQVEALTTTAAGAELPYSPTMTTPEGKTVNLADLLGKFTYIDVWATWCAPCCKEIPHLERVVEHFKGNQDVQILSISVDDSHEAWLGKLAADKPAWPQYILSKEENQKFMSKWGISGIPRFIMIDAEGKIFAADALRPSDADLISTIEAQIK